MGVNPMKQWFLRLSLPLAAVLYAVFLLLDLTGWAGDQWEVMSGSASAFSGWNDASRVTLGGESAAWDSDISGWCSSNYQLTLEEDGDGRKLIIAGKLA